MLHVNFGSFNQHIWFLFFKIYFFYFKAKLKLIKYYIVNVHARNCQRTKQTPDWYAFCNAKLFTTCTQKFDVKCFSNHHFFSSGTRSKLLPPPLPKAPARRARWAPLAMPRPSVGVAWARWPGLHPSTQAMELRVSIMATHKKDIHLVNGMISF